VKIRHRVALLCVIADLVILNTRARLSPAWLWDGAYWILLGVAGLAVLSEVRARRGRKGRRV
jgi:hypothetical protein